MKLKLRRPSKNEAPDTRVFGTPLDKDVPLVVSVAMRLLQDKYILTEGIFRVSGDNKAMQELRQQFDEGLYKTEEQIKAALLQYKEHTIAGMVKMWFRDLPEPLLTFDHYDMFLAAHGVPQDTTRLCLIKKVLRFLPSTNLHVLRTITEFLHLLTIFEDSNRMNAESLSIIFAPNLLRPRGGNLLEMKRDTPQSIGLMRTLIEEYVFLFEQDDKVLEIKGEPQSILEFSSPSEATATIRRVTMSLSDMQDSEAKVAPAKAPVTPAKQGKKRVSLEAQLDKEEPPAKRLCATLDVSSPLSSPSSHPRGRQLPQLPNSPSYLERMQRPHHKRSITVAAFGEISSPSKVEGHDRIYFKEAKGSPLTARGPRPLGVSNRGALPTPPKRL
jgi:hypothetical protein